MREFGVEVFADNSGRWCGNECAFATREEGEVETGKRR